jgi:hypothetical protein
MPSYVNAVLGVKSGAPSPTDVEDDVILDLERDRWRNIVLRRAARAMPQAADGATPAQVQARADRIARLSQRIKDVERDLTAIVAKRGVDDTAP